MALYLVEGPELPVIDLAEMKQHLRVDGDDENDLIESAVAAATEQIDGRDGWLGRALVSQRWDMKIQAFAETIVIPLPPLRDVISVSYLDPDGAEQTLPVDTYHVLGVGSAAKGRLIARKGKAWPATLDHPEAVTVRFRAGYLDTAASPATGRVPAPIVASIKRQAASLFENRESVVIGASAVKLPGAVEAMLAPYRVW